MATAASAAEAAIQQRATPSRWRRPPVRHGLASAPALRCAGRRALRLALCLGAYLALEEAVAGDGGSCSWAILPGAPRPAERAGLLARAAARRSPPAARGGPRTSSRRGRPPKETPPPEEPEASESEGEGEDEEKKMPPPEPMYEDDDEDFPDPMPKRRKVKRIQDEEILPPGTKYQGGRHGVQFFVGDMVEAMRDGKLTVARMARIPTDERPMDRSFIVKWDSDGEEWKCTYKDLRKPRDPEAHPLPDWVEDWWPEEPPPPDDPNQEWNWVSKLRPPPMPEEDQGPYR